MPSRPGPCPAGPRAHRPVSQITMGIELRRAGKTLNSVKEEVTA